MTQEKWEQLYRENLQQKTYWAEKEKYDRQYLQTILDHVFASYHFQAGDTFLEIGCGPMFLGQELARRGLKVIGMDFSPAALEIATKMFQASGLTNYQLIQSGLAQMPLPDNSVDFIYGGGVIEHFDNPRSIIKEMFRVTKNGGWAFNTVPQLNLSALTYRQLWGNIPDFPLLKQLAEIVHLNLLKGRLMKFGYELSFTKSKMRRLFSQAGFRRAEVTNFHCFLPFEYFPSEKLKKIARRVAQTNLFNPMLLISAQK